VRSLGNLRESRGKKMRFQTMLEGAECLRRSDAGWQSVPGTRRSDEVMRGSSSSSSSSSRIFI